MALNRPDTVVSSLLRMGRLCSLTLNSASRRHRDVREPLQFPRLQILQIDSLCFDYTVAYHRCYIIVLHVTLIFGKDATRLTWVICVKLSSGRLFDARQKNMHVNPNHTPAMKCTKPQLQNLGYKIGQSCFLPAFHAVSKHSCACSGILRASLNFQQIMSAVCTT